MKLLVISDTHGRIIEAENLINSLSGIDCVVHLGDYQRDGLKLESKCGVPVIALKGNTDGSFSNEGYRIVDTEYGKLYLSHGHMEAVKRGPENILYKAFSLGCKAALYGHTHVPEYRNLGEIYLLNPGSLAFPRGNRPGSYAVIVTSKEAFQAEIFFLDAEREKTGVFARIRSGLGG